MGLLKIWKFSFFCFFLTQKLILSDETCKSTSRCFYFQGNSIPNCPENFSEGVSICYYITELSAFPPKCPFKNVLPFDSYKDIISTNGPIWMPVRRDVSNGLGFLEWVEASTLYKTEFDRDFYVSGEIEGKDCLVYHNTNKTVLVSCEEEYSGVCAYNYLNQMNQEKCASLGMCHQSDFDTDSACVCLGGSNQNQNDYIKAEFLKPYQNIIYGTLTSDDCTIGLEKTPNNTYIWTNSRKEIDYTLWSEEAIFTNTHIYGALTEKGWILTEQPLQCFLYQEEIQIPEAEIQLVFDGLIFHLTVTNSQSLKKSDDSFLIYCFSSPGPLSLTYRYPMIDKIEEFENGTILYQFEPHKHGPANYWCEGFNHNSETIKTEVVFANESQRYGNEFVAILQTDYIEGTNPLSQNFIDFLHLIFFVKLKSNESSDKPCSTYTSNLLKIISIDEVNHQAWINIHFTCLIPKKQTNNLQLSSFTDSEFNRMEELVKNIISDLGDITMRLLEFRSATYCPEETDSNFSWPRTPLNGLAVPSEYCFKSDGIRMERFCGGDFIHGAQWATVKENCIFFPQHSTVTEELLNVTQNSDQIDQVNEISKRYEEFDSFDVYLLALITKDNYDKIDAATLVNILDNLFKVKDGVLTNAQNQTRAMDMVLETIDNIAPSDNITSDNFLRVSINLQESRGIILLENGVIEILKNDFDLQSVLDTYPNWEGAVFLNSQVRTNQKIIFKVYKNSNFFSSSKQNLPRNIFGVESQNLPVSVVYKVTNSSTVDCVYWKYDLVSSDGRGVWTQVNKMQTSSSYVKCDFLEVKSTALTIMFSDANTKENVTDDLENLLESDESPVDIMSELSEISDRYDEFTSDDIYLLSEILEKMRNSSTIHLTDLAHVVSNLHQIQRPILFDSQKQKLATDSILHSVDRIIQTHNYTSPVNVTEENFMIFMTDIKKSDFSGLVLFENEKVQTLNLTGDVNMSDVMKLENFSSVLVVPNALKQQLVDGKIIVTVFPTDGLFNQDITNFNYVSKIFGIILNLVEEFAAPLSFFHKVSGEKFQRSCVYWSYDTHNNVTGIWKEDNTGKNFYKMSQCEFWHNTHFALLLLDTDEYDYDALDWITSINCGLSMFGLCCIILTAVFFKRWRTNSGNQILLNFVFVSILQICIFYTSSSVNKDSDDALICTIIGIILHYSIVSQFCWMFVIAVLQFKRFVEVLKGPPKHVLLKACLCGWVLPCLPIAAVYFFDNDNYVNGNVGLCYPSGLGLYLGVWLPIAIVVVINLVIFIYIIYSVVYRRTECSDVGNNEVMFQWRLAILLFFMLGMTWTFGFLSELDFGVVFVYVFCTTATLQGFVMFLFFIVFNSNTRFLYANAFKRRNKNY